MPIIINHPNGGESVHYTWEGNLKRGAEMARKIDEDDFTPLERSIMEHVFARSLHPKGHDDGR